MKLYEYFKARFKDLIWMEIREEIISPFDIEVERENLNSFLKVEYIEITFDLQEKPMHTFKIIG